MILIKEHDALLVTRGFRRQASLNVAADEAHEVINLLLIEPIFEGGHAVAAVRDLLGEFRVGMRKPVPFQKARNF